MSTLVHVVVVLLLALFFVLGIVSVAVTMNHFAPTREVRVVRPGRCRKLTRAERDVQSHRGLIYCTEESIKISFLLDGQREQVTIPKNRIFDGDSLRQYFGMDSYGNAWVVHDWLYSIPHTTDSGTVLTHRKHADEIMYELLSNDGVCNMVYASLLRLFDSLISTRLDRAWETVVDRTYTLPT